MKGFFQKPGLAELKCDVMLHWIHRCNFPIPAGILQYTYGT